MRRQNVALVRQSPLTVGPPTLNPSREIRTVKDPICTSDRSPSLGITFFQKKSNVFESFVPQRGRIRHPGSTHEVGWLLRRGLVVLHCVVLWLSVVLLGLWPRSTGVGGKAISITKNFQVKNVITRQIVVHVTHTPPVERLRRGFDCSRLDRTSRHRGKSGAERQCFRW